MDLFHFIMKVIYFIINLAYFFVAFSTITFISISIPLPCKHFIIKFPISSTTFSLLFRVQ